MSLYRSPARALGRVCRWNLARWLLTMTTRRPYEVYTMAAFHAFIAARLGKPGPTAAEQADLAGPDS
ncbi:hypothetical protein ACVWZL_000033 [Bradyrhizobium sp. GM2.4]